MNNLFAQSRSHWVRYDRYEIKTGKDGKRYITPEKTAKPDVYNPLKESSEMVLEALNVGMLMMNRRSEDVAEKAILAFVTHYGLLGLMTALPTTPSFMDYEAVYLPKNHFIKEESMATEDYLALFYPFDKLDVVKRGVESSWNVSGDNMMIALTMTFMDEPMAKNMSFQREYAEPYDWVAQQFKDWAFTLPFSTLALRATCRIAWRCPISLQCVERRWGVTSSYIQCLDVIQKLQTRGIQPKISDLSDTLNLPQIGRASCRERVCKQV